jgi:predicted Zn-dependent protease
MKKTVAFIALIAFMYSCSSVPITGRKQLSLVSDDEVMSLSLQEYSDYIKTAQKSTDKTNTALVVKVGQNIAGAVTAYYKSVGQESLLNGYAWEFNLIKDPQVNAFCMPGGKIVVYEGILPYTQNETGLAVVLGHEVAHAVAKHANERMSQQVAAQYGSTALGVILGSQSETAQTIAGTVYGLGSQYGVMLPFSRKQELEADQLGLVFMAIAGYDPHEAVPFWQRMAAQGNAVPEFMSTHPSDQTRISKIQSDFLPLALKYYNTGKISGSSSGTPSNAKTDSKWSF